MLVETENRCDDILYDSMSSASSLDWSLSSSRPLILHLDLKLSLTVILSPPQFDWTLINANTVSQAHLLIHSNSEPTDRGRLPQVNVSSLLTPAG